MLQLLHAFHSFNLGAWHLEPTVVSGTFIVVSFYLYGAFTRPGGFLPWRAGLFLLGVTAMSLSLVSPLDVAADRLLSMHMLQHVFLTTIGPPLVLMGLPPGLLSPLLSRASILRIARKLMHPVVTGPLFVVNMWFWHVPPVYELALSDIWVHVAMHLAFMASGILFWWPVVQPASETGRFGDGARLLYLFVAGMPMALLALLFFASGGVIYDHYDVADPFWGIDPMVDQQIAGLIMGGLGEVASFTAVTLLFFRVLGQEDQSASQPPRPADAGQAE